MPESVITENSGRWLEVGLNFTFITVTWLTFIAILAASYYLYCMWVFQCFKRIGINGPQPTPFFGTSLPLLQLGMMEHDMKMRKHGKVVGTFQGLIPQMFVFDVDILKQILGKNFSTFLNRVVPPIDSIPSKMMHMLKDDDWKRVRGIVNPTFSSGKMRKMLAQIRRCADILQKNLMNHAEKQETFDLTIFTSTFTMDVIASVAFGIEIDSHNDPNNKFVQMGRKSFMFKLASLPMIVFFFFPSMIRPMSKLGYRIFPSDVTEFFVEVIDRAVEQRRQGQNDESIDFLQLMINAHEDDDETKSAEDKKDPATTWKYEGSGEKASLSREELLAQGLIFFLAGFETTANTLAFLGYQLAVNPEIQDRLIREIDDVMKDHDVVDYDIIKQMPYLDMCISETLRLYPPGPRTDRVASSDITINGVFIPKDMQIVIPIFAIHRDPELWPEPEKFNPERFTSEEKAARSPYSFLPFGGGPRGCAGMLLALTELKVSVVTILQKLKFVRAAETEVPLTLGTLGVKSPNGIKVRVEKRKL